MTRDEKADIARKQSRRFASDPELRRAVAQAGYGASLIWEASWKGTPMADLIDPYPESDFWVSYRIVSLAPTPELAEMLESATFWINPHIVYRNREHDLVATSAFAAGDGPNKGRIPIDGLSFELQLSLVDRLILQWRSFRRNSEIASQPSRPR